MERRRREKQKCSDGVEGCLYLINNYCQIEDPQRGIWLPFELWPEQEDVVRAIFDNQFTAMLKARQIGLSWLVLSVMQWWMNFRPGSAMLITSKRDDEAVALVDHRLKQQHKRLPSWLKSPTEGNDSKHEWWLANGSRAHAFPSAGGDSYTGSMALIDEADLVPDLTKTRNALKPTIEAGGKLIEISKPNKSTPNSPFKRTVRAGLQGLNEYKVIFLPWHVRPERTAEWYEKKRAAAMADDGHLDNLHENYPATVAEALSPKSEDKRLPVQFIDKCYKEAPALPEEIWRAALAVVNATLPDDQKITLPETGLVIYRLAEPDRKYAIGGDPAEGNPTSDDSAAQVLDAASWEQVARLKGKFEVSVFAAHIDAISRFFNRATALIERNNHGHAVLLWLRDNTYCECMEGEDGRPGWVSSTKGKTMMYDNVAEVLHDGDTMIHDWDTYLQLASIESRSLRAPQGDNDDLADSYTLAVIAAQRVPTGILF